MKVRVSNIVLWDGCYVVFFFWGGGGFTRYFYVNAGTVLKVRSPIPGPRHYTLIIAKFTPNSDR